MSNWNNDTLLERLRDDSFNAARHALWADILIAGDRILKLYDEHGEAEADELS